VRRTDRHAISRRHFLKATAAGALALSAGPTIFIPRRVEAYQPGGKIHPYINPLRVVGARDPRMTTGQNPLAAWPEQERLVATEVVHENMDKMAMALAQEKSVADAWGKIFVKPPNKAWSDAVIAVKINHIAQQRTRSAVLSKLCHVFTDVLGARASNIYAYDACNGRNMAQRNPYAGLPEGTNLAGQWGGSDVSTAVPAPYAGGQKQSQCLGHLVKGEVDVLVDLALCKGHGPEWGRFTMCMKNHFGTFVPGPGHGPGGGADYLIAINKTPEILGAMDPATGNVLYPRQQLCLVDALWASDPGPSGPTDSQPNALLMGVCAPVVDYVGAMRFRKEMMGWTVQERVAERFLTEFGFSAAELDNGGRIVDALSA